MTASWRELLGRPLDGNHIAQIYRDEDFLVDALSRQLAIPDEQVVICGLATVCPWHGNGEAVLNVREIRAAGAPIGTYCGPSTAAM